MAREPANWIDQAFFGIRYLLSGEGEEALPERTTLKILGDVTIEDDAEHEWTTLTFPTGVEGATPSTYVRRDESGDIAAHEVLVEGVELSADIAGEQRRLTGTPYAISHQWIPDIDGKWLSILTNGVMYVPLNADLPQGCEVSAITITITGGSPHGALPATMPTVELFGVVGGAAVPIGDVTDTSADVAAYEDRHDLTILLDPPVVISKEVTDYRLLVRAESGVGSLVGTQYEGGAVLFTRPAGTPLGRD